MRVVVKNNNVAEQRQLHHQLRSKIFNEPQLNVVIIFPGNKRESTCKLELVVEFTKGDVF